jgi:cell division protein DivIC
MKGILRKIKIPRIPIWMKNRYAITGLAFIIWLLLFDKNDLISQYKIQNELSKLEEEKAFFMQEIKKDQEKLMELRTNHQTLEKFAREKYLMKRDNEEIFVIVEK